MAERARDDRLGVLKLARDVQQKEVDYRRDKRWKIFSWASSLLLTGIGGVVVITADIKETLLLWPHKISLMLAVLILATYAIAWLERNYDLEMTARANVHRLDEQIGLYDGVVLEQPKRMPLLQLVIYPVIVGLLGLVAILIVLLS